MKKPLIFTLAIFTTVLMGCQESQTPTTSTISEEDFEKAMSQSAVQIQVADPNGVVTVDGLTIEGLKEGESLEVIADDEVTNTTSSSILLDRIGIVVTEEGIVPESITAPKGGILMISNSQDKQIDLYTTSNGSQDCGLLDATIEIPGKQTKEFELDTIGSCTIISQLNTDHKMEITVEE